MIIPRMMYVMLQHFREGGRGLGGGVGRGRNLGISPSCMYTHVLPFKSFAFHPREVIKWLLILFIVP